MACMANVEFTVTVSAPSAVGTVSDGRVLSSACRPASSAASGSG